MVKIFDIKNDKFDFDFNYNNEETKILQNEMKNKQDININDLRRISLWKLDRVLNVDEMTINNLQKIAITKDIHIDDELVMNTIKELVKSDGIGFPMASSILKFLRPDIFPIIDVRAYRALYGKKISYSQYTIEKYINYIKDISKIAIEKNIDLTQVDEQLYCFDKQNNGKI